MNHLPSTKPAHKNGDVGGALLVQLAVIYIPFFNSLFRTEALSMEELAYCFLFSAVVFHAVKAENGFVKNFTPFRIK